MGHWSIDQRPLAGSPDAPTVNGQPLVLFHFSGFQTERPTQLSRYDEAARVGEPLTTLLARYRTELLAAGHDSKDATQFYGALG